VTLTAGVAVVDITPIQPVPLAGFASRQSEFDRVDRPLFAKVWAFEERGRRALLVQADLIWWGSERMPQLRQKLKERFGVQEEAVILHATHTHGGPQMSERFVPELGRFDEPTVTRIESLLLEGVAEAFSRMEPVKLERGRGSCDIGINRRKLEHGQAVMAPNPDGPNDAEVTVILLRRSSGDPLGVWFHYTCHPTTTSDSAVTPDFPGAAMERVEEWLGGAAAVSFLQGCCGDIRPAVIRDGQFAKGTLDDVRELGERLAQSVIRVLQGPLEALPTAELAWRQEQVQLPLELGSSIPLELTCLRLAKGASLLAMDGEIVVEYGLFVKGLSHGSVLPLPYSNGMIGYVPTAKQLAEGGYEAKDSTYYFRLPSPFGASAEERLRAAIERILRS